MEEVKFCGSSSTNVRLTTGVTTEDDPNILTVESMTEVEVFLTIEETTI
jgi:hypothetical protein